MLKKILIVLLALTLITTPAMATCPASWNDPALTCIITQNWHDFVNNWTYQNTSIWNNFASYDTISNQSQVNQSLWASLNSANSAMLFHNGTRVMTGSLNAGGFNVSNVSTPVVSTDAATKGYTDSEISSAESLVSGWIQTNNSATLSMVSSWISENNSATLSTADAHIASNMSGVLHLTGGTMTGQIDSGGYNLSNVSAPISSGDAVNLNYFNTYPSGNGDTWNAVVVNSSSLAVNNGYIPTNTTRTQFILPATASPGQSVKITGFGSGGWVIGQNAGQTIYFTGLVNTTPGTTGNVTSNTAYDSISLRCTATNTAWVAELFTGNLQVN
jgi:hypothetical protein